MHRVLPTQTHPLHSIAATHRLEQVAIVGLPAHTLMQRAGLAVAPHARCVWLACGPGNNGGDGLEAALHLQAWGKRPVVTWLGNEASAPADALASLRRARDAGVLFSAEPPEQFDQGIDALLGIGANRAPSGRMAQWIARLNSSGQPVLAVDVPSGLNADTGAPLPAGSIENATNSIANYQGATLTSATFCLNLLCLKPGMFTASGRDHAGQVWLDDLGFSAETGAPDAWLVGADMVTPPARLHASHKGSYGDVAVFGGAPGMTGAALLAARAALHAGAGRGFVALLDGGSLPLDGVQPELMLRHPDTLDVRAITVVCGCGGGDAVRAVLSRLLSTAPRLVLDADALNAIAQDSQLQHQLRARAARGWPTLLTPHPLEAARLLGVSTAQVQANRLTQAQTLAERFACIAVLKGSGSVIAAPGAVPHINPTGNARLATAGTGDVLAGMVGAALAGMQASAQTPLAATCAAVFRHGELADAWPHGEVLTASALATAASH